MTKNLRSYYLFVFVFLRVQSGQKLSNVSSRHLKYSRTLVDWILWEGLDRRDIIRLNSSSISSFHLDGAKNFMTKIFHSISYLKSRADSRPFSSLSGARFDDNGVLLLFGTPKGGPGLGVEAALAGFARFSLRLISRTRFILNLKSNSLFFIEYQWHYSGDLLPRMSHKCCEAIKFEKKNKMRLSRVVASWRIKSSGREPGLFFSCPAAEQQLENMAHWSLCLPVFGNYITITFEKFLLCDH